MYIYKLNIFKNNKRVLKARAWRVLDQRLRRAQKGHKSRDVVSQTDLFQFKMFLLFLFFIFSETEQHCVLLYS